MKMLFNDITEISCRGHGIVFLSLMHHILPAQRLDIIAQKWVMYP